MSQVKIITLVGLPGCGKTHYTSKFDGLFNNIIIHFDDYKNKTLQNVFDNNFRYRFDAKSNSVIVFDGLFCSEKSRSKVIFGVIDYITNRYYSARSKTRPQFILEFVQWNDDEYSRRKCLHNDSARGREVPATTTIKNADIEPVSLEFYKQNESIISVKVKKMEVHRTTYFEREFLPYSSDNNPGVLNGEEWSNGGTWCDYNGDESPVGVDEPREFDELDELLSRVCPNISFLHYKHIIKNIAQKLGRSEHDYYGGTSHYMYWSIDLHKLYDFLKEKNYIDENKEL